MNRALSATPLGRSRWTHHRWLVIAPHADDETIGAGALISDAAARRKLAGLVILTDGAGSHSSSRATDVRRLVATRKQEARAAIRILVPDAARVIFLDWPDANPWSASDPAFANSVQRLTAFCHTQAVDAIAVTGRDEPHCDHVAAFDLARAVTSRAFRRIALFEYLVWAKQLPGPDFDVVRTASMNLGRRRAALARHRSQMTPLFGDGFRVPQHLRAMSAHDLLYTHR